MSKIRIYLEKSTFNDELEITSPKASHKLTSVLRIREGADIYIFDGKGSECRYCVRRIHKASIGLERTGDIQSQKEDNVKVILGFPLMREIKVALLLQKATELGAWGFIPFRCGHSLQDARAAKIKRWGTIIIEAARQSDRVWVPSLEEPIRFNELIKRYFDVKLYGQRDGIDINEINLGNAKANVCVLIGPEGDFTDQERSRLTKGGYKAVRLSRNILRAETAALFSVGMLKNKCHES